MSPSKNSILIGMLPILDEPPLASQPAIAQNANPQSASPHSTGSALLDSFRADAAQNALSSQAALTQELTSLSFELKRINARASKAQSSKAQPSKISPATREAASEIAKNVTKNVIREAVKDPNRETAIREAIIRQVAIKEATQANAAVPAQAQQRERKRPRLSPPAAKAVGKAISQAIEQAEKNSVAQNKTTQNKALDRTARRHPEFARPQSTGTQNTQSPQSPQSTQPKVASRTPFQPQTTSQAKVYGGSQYKALQAKAAAGGLVNLDDALLFGGADKKISNGGLGNPLNAHLIQLEAELLEYLGHSLEDFTTSPIPGGIHLTAHLGQGESQGNEPSTRSDSLSDSLLERGWHQAVLNIDTFKLSDLTPEEDNDNLQQRQTVGKEPASEANNETGLTGEKPVNFSDLGQQVIYLNQKIDYLSKKLAALTSEGSTDVNQLVIQPVHQSEKTSELEAIKPDKKQSSVVLGVLGIETFKVVEAAQSAEKRVAILDSLFELPPP